MQLFTKHRDTLYTKEGEPLSPADYEEGAVVEAFSNSTGKANRKPLSFTVTRSTSGRSRFTRKGLLG